MIPIAKGKFPQPRKPRPSNELIPEYIPPIQEPAPQPDPSLEETMVLTSTFEPIRDAAPVGETPVSPVPQETISFEESEFLKETSVCNTEAPLVSPKLTDDTYIHNEELRYRKQEIARKKARKNLDDLKKYYWPLTYKPIL